jgi:hypothetical protein
MTDLELAAYLDRRLSAAERERTEAHLAGCASCREELAQSYQLRQRLRRPGRLAVGALVAVAAAIFLVIRTGMVLGPAPADEPVVRSDDAPAIVAYAPVGETSSSSLRFVWGAQARATSYRLTVSRADGTTIWSRSSVDTAVSLPDSVSLRTGERYLWVADALLDDGGTRSTGLHQFRVAP